MTCFHCACYQNAAQSFSRGPWGPSFSLSYAVADSMNYIALHGAVLYCTVRPCRLPFPCPLLLLIYFQGDEQFGCISQLRRRTSFVDVFMSNDWWRFSYLRSLDFCRMLLKLCVPRSKLKGSRVDNFCHALPCVLLPLPCDLLPLHEIISSCPWVSAGPRQATAEAGARQTTAAAAVFGGGPTSWGE